MQWQPLKMFIMESENKDNQIWTWLLSKTELGQWLNVERGSFLLNNNHDIGSYLESTYKQDPGMC